MPRRRSPEIENDAAEFADRTASFSASPIPNVSEGDKSMAEVTTADEQATMEVNLLEWMTPLGKPLAACTGIECGILGRFFIELAATRPGKGAV